MGRSQDTFHKRQREKKKLRKKKEKLERKKIRQENSADGSELSEMIAFVDEFGNIVDEKPEDTPKIPGKLGVKIENKDKPEN